MQHRKKSNMQSNKCNYRIALSLKIFLGLKKPLSLKIFLGLYACGRGDIYIDGLTSAPELNGRIGCVLGFDSCSGRYKIDVEGCGAKRIKRCNLLIEEDVGDYDGDVEDVNAFDVSELSSGPCDLDIFKFSPMAARMPTDHIFECVQ